MDLTDYFLGVAAKSLTAVDADNKRSNQHEFGGLTAAGIGQLLGQPGEDVLHYQADFHYFPEDGDVVSLSDIVSWYDTRKGQAGRSAELRLYYRDNEVSKLITAGDLMIVGVRPDMRITMFFVPSESATASTLCHLFGIEPSDTTSFVGEVFRPDRGRLDIARATILQLLNLEPIPARTDETLESILLQQFGRAFPSTAEFSSFARTSIPALDAELNADTTLLTWMQREEELFRALERMIVEEKLDEGFADVEEFIAFSLSVQNRRKSRVGHAFENHLEEVFQQNGIQYERGAMTENRSRPDFLFPDGRAYHDRTFPTERLFMLGVKTTCKDRWRQVLSEAERLPDKYLLTLETAISAHQTEEMMSNNLQLVIPSPLHITFSAGQQRHLMTVRGFIQRVRSTQEGLVQEKLF